MLILDGLARLCRSMAMALPLNDTKSYDSLFGACRCKHSALWSCCQRTSLPSRDVQSASTTTSATWCSNFQGMTTMLCMLYASWSALCRAACRANSVTYNAGHLRASAEPQFLTSICMPCRRVDASGLIKHQHILTVEHAMDAAIPALYLFISGGTGVGKSFVINLLYAIYRGGTSSCAATKDSPPGL